MAAVGGAGEPGPGQKVAKQRCFRLDKLGGTDGLRDIFQNYNHSPDRTFLGLVVNHVTLDASLKVIHLKFTYRKDLPGGVPDGHAVINIDDRTGGIYVQLLGRLEKSETIKAHFDSALNNHYRPYSPITRKLDTNFTTMRALLFQAVSDVDYNCEKAVNEYREGFKPTDPTSPGSTPTDFEIRDRKSVV